MKRTIIIIVFIFSANSNNAQSLIDTSNVWTVFHISHPGGNTFYDHHTYKFIGDTTLGLYQYNLLKWSYDSTLVSQNFAGAWREDSLGKIYINNFQNEYMIYDFSLTLNDTFIYDPSMGGPIELIVDSIDYVVLLTGESRKRLFFNLSTIPEIWIEGIGSTKAIDWMGYDYYPNVDLYTMVCFAEHDTLKYLNSGFQSCYHNPYVIGQSEISDEIKLSIFPNPCKSNCNLRIEGLTNQYYELRIFDAYGKNCFISNTTIDSNNSINLNEFQSGLYFYKLTDSKNISKSGKFIITE